MRKKKKHPILIGLLVLVVLALLASLGSSGDKSEPAKSAEAEVPAEEHAGAEEPAEEPVADEPAEAPAETEEASAEEPAEETPADGISPELKAFLDSYEAFMDEYCAFMETYDSSDAAALLKYSSLMEKYVDFSAKADEWNSREMNDAETLYYIQVMNRVNEKLLKVSSGL